MEDCRLNCTLRTGIHVLFLQWITLIILHGVVFGDHSETGPECNSPKPYLSDMILLHHTIVVRGALVTSMFLTAIQDVGSCL